eukprot:GHVU01009148.1.p1 GENE.GHVU01009148.1~~GHVU01009148.1.p1  ORF type:complete len:345 (+),score=15.02 GHVU01009148.1:389-1423(+)
MNNKASQAQKGNWSWRIKQEAEQKQEDGWYPFFVTLTIDPKKCDGIQHYDYDQKPLPIYNSPRELWEKGREFRKYIKRLASVAAHVLGHPSPHKKNKKFGYRPESDYITYAGVIEHGKSQEHHHAHIMIWMKAIPHTWKVDPNSGRMPQYRYQRECKLMRHYWPWCVADQKPALYFRSKGDIWSRMGHVTPIDKETGQPINIAHIQAVGNYITKYMQKGTKLWHHRMKCTRNLGMQKNTESNKQSQTGTTNTANMETTAQQPPPFSEFDPFRAARYRALSSETKALCDSVSIGITGIENLNEDQLRTLQEDAEERSRWSEARSDAFSGLLRLGATVPPRGKRVL